MVFGKVSIPEELKGKGFAADFEPHQRAYHHKLPPAHVAWGIGANMSARRSHVRATGNLDPLLGPGSPFRAGEETDLAIRAIVGGYKIVNAAEIAALAPGGPGGRRSLEADARLRQGYGRNPRQACRLGTRESRALTPFVGDPFRRKGAPQRRAGDAPNGPRIGRRHAGRRLLSLSQPIDRTHGVYTNR